MIRISFDFKNRSAEELAQLNKLLATMKLSDLQLENLDGYMATTRDHTGKITFMRYGFDSGTLVCELADNEYGHTYQIETIVVLHTSGLSHDECVELWREINSHRVLRKLIAIGDEESTAYVFIHHEKK